MQTPYRNSMLDRFSRLVAGLVLVAVTLFAPVPAIEAAAGINRYVSPGGSDTTDCTSSASPCQTIAYALNQSDPGDTLLLDAGIYHENLVIDKSIRILQNPAKFCPYLKLIGGIPPIYVLVPCATIDGSSTGRVIDINTYSSQVSLEKLTIRNGAVTGANESGAGIRNNASLIMDDVTLHHNVINSADNYVHRGGAIDNQHDLTLRGSSLHDNSAYDGGGISSTGTLVVQNTQIYANSAVRYGGGVWVPYGSPATLENTTLYENSAGTGGGGVFINSDGDADHMGTLHYLRNVTISANTSSSYGGGLVSNLYVNIDHSTLTLNSSLGGGGDLFLFENQTTVGMGYAHSLVANTIVSNPTATDPVCLIVDAALFNLSGGGNLSSDHSCDFNLIGDQQDTDPDLLPLADNGGPVRTHALPFGSPAIDAAGGYALGADARGVLPQDGDLNGSVVPDCGAYEFAFLHTYIPVVRR